MSAFNCRSTNYFGASNFDVRAKSGAKTPRTPKHFVRNAQQAPLRFAQPSECDRVLASLLLLQVIRGVSIDIVRYRSNTWMGDRVVDCARLESVCAERHRGFESPPIRPASRLALRRTGALLSNGRVRFSTVATVRLREAGRPPKL